MKNEIINKYHAVSTVHTQQILINLIQCNGTWWCKTSQVNIILNTVTPRT